MAGGETQSNRASKPTREARIFLLGWTALCVLVLSYGLSLLWTPLKTVTWDSVPCRIERFEIVDDPTAHEPFRADLVFHYQVNGTIFTGTRLWPRDEASRYYDQISKIREELSKGQSLPLAGVITECRVNRADPSEASLRLEPWESIRKGLAIFLGGGLLVIVGLASLVDFKREASRPVFMVAATVVLFGGGGLAMVGALVVQCLQVSEKGDWKETSARVVWSRVAKPSEANTRTRIPDLFYAYEFQGKSYHSNRYDVTGNHRRGEVRQIVAASPVGSVLKVYVDPQKPWRAVVDRNRGELPFLAGWALALVVAGAAGSWWLVKAAKRSQTAPRFKQRSRP